MCGISVDVEHLDGSRQNDGCALFIWFLSLFCLFFFFSLKAIVAYYYEHQLFLHYWLLCFWIMLVTYLTLKACINSTAAPLLFSNVGGKRKSLLLMACIFLVSLVALVTNAVGTMGIPLWLSYNNKAMPTTAQAEHFNATLLFEVAFGIGLFLALLDVCLAPKQMEKRIEKKINELAEKVPMFDILFH